MADCIFCKIAEGVIPCVKIMENDDVIAFLDINPLNTGHTLVLPKKHYVTLFDLPEPVLQACMSAVHKIAEAVFKASGKTGLNLLQNNYRSAGQYIDHVHFHLVPRHVGDGFMTTWPAKPCPPAELAELLAKIKGAL